MQLPDNANNTPRSEEEEDEQQYSPSRPTPTPPPHPSSTLQFATIHSSLSPSYNTSHIPFSDPSIPPIAYIPQPTTTSSPFSQPLPLQTPPSDTHNPLYHGPPPNIARDANTAAATEHHMTLTHSLRLYPHAIAWSTLLSLPIVMEGFSVTLLPSLYAFPRFKRTYGHLLPDGTYQLPAAWQAALTDGALAGECVGLLVNGVLTDRFGNRLVMVGSLALLCAFIALAFFARNSQILLASQLLCGLPWGLFQTLSLTYAADCLPLSLRAYVTSNVNLCWLIGQLISVGTLRGFTRTESQWSYRIPFALQWLWAVPILIGTLFAPESPWWLVRHGKPEEARRALGRLTSKRKPQHLGRFNIDDSVAMMQHTNAVEKYLSEGTSYLSCFKGSDLRRTEIACGVWMTQSICGVMTGYATYFYTRAGLPTEGAFNLSTAMYGAGILGAFLSWFLMRIAGRRMLYLWGVALCAVVLAVAGFVGTRKESAAVSWVLGSLIVLVTFIYDSTIGPICYALVAEIPSTRLRVKTVVLARVAYNILSLITNVLMPQLLNPNAWNWKGKTCLLWAAGAGLAWVWCYFRLPEPKRLTYIELDLLFEKKASARKFSRVQANLSESGYFSVDIGGSEGCVRWHEEVSGRMRKRH
ncbi:MFS alpha-glucoside transporter-like protein [Lepidopterella palustris CBS 459.81]|uniref:MFS alpha-glucoside transporter-like protein n=1 Tax=Lepidopterella palustris CBS 459.81 TaxID=1314670 RepID=A0A8E2E166_9PEZI|nr:MFS alpha-glucoside transporter-like protein [Lepidopterella palustris CBS 459.81]